MHHEMRTRPYQANSTLAMLSKFFGWAEKHGLRPDGSNPCRHIEKYREGRRERFLSQTELGRLGSLARGRARQDLLPLDSCCNSPSHTYGGAAK